MKAPQGMGERLAAGMTQVELATAAGVSPRQIARLEAEGSVPNALILSLLFRSRATPMEWLLLGDVNPRWFVPRGNLASTSTPIAELREARETNA